ncbi:hypothetical protein PLESTB_001810100 [Pleodorina starrii]|uniref:Uncharacterized protein n=1 Tax=Pleodorina starrii TaxID=330485 RepID=A0A9W6C152_9CHLO|nr:hypothetical protein PLESTM_000906400 [Pleodorina starrii]GLC61849.1 hypothetical protein PLESTB_001810100 [Pleodorina starrii]GLC76910.1 hypothetical protein PLESTF_001854500 [Pleodorina starrii]
MLFPDFRQAGAWSGHGGNPATSSHSNNLKVPPTPQRPCGRRLLKAVAAQRRPINRNLLDNVDSAVPDGFSSYGPSPYVTTGEELRAGPIPGDVPGGAGPAPQAWQPAEPPAWADAGGSVGDWSQDPQALPQQPPLQQPQSQQQAQADGTYSSLRTPAAAEYCESGHPQGTAQWSSDPHRTIPPRPTWDGPPSDAPGIASAAPSEGLAGEQPAAAPQEPRQGQPPLQQPPRVPYSRPAAGSDWGEVDPLTDWGGVAYSDGSGWDEPYGGDGAAPPPPSSSSSRTTAGEPRAGENGAAAGAAASGSGAAGDGRRDGGRAYGGWGGGAAAADAATDPDGAAATDPDWARAGPGWRGEGTGWAPPYGSYGAWTGQPYGNDATGGGSGAASSSGASPSPDAFRPSDIVLLPGQDASSMLPLAPMSTQVDFFQPRTLQERIVQFVGSIGASVILSKAAVLAGPALLYPIWSPWIRAGIRNLDLYSKNFACVGLWRAEVLDVQINGLAIGGMLLSKEPPVVSLLVGDPWVGGARVSLELPYQLRSETIRTGDAVELLVLSRDDRFSSFKVVRELYLPQSGVWLYDYPYVNRDLFVAVSVTVERQRRAEAAAAAAAQYYTYDVAAASGAAAPSEVQPQGTDAGSGPGSDMAPGAEYGMGSGPGFGVAGGAGLGAGGGEPFMGRGAGSAAGAESGLGVGAAAGSGPAEDGGAAAAPSFSRGLGGDLGSGGSWSSGEWR